MKIRVMTEEDVPGTAALERECFSDAWSEKSLREMADSPHTLFMTAESEGEIVGFCGVQTVLDEGEILRVAVSPSCRGEGLASALLEAVWRRKPEIRLWNLEVRAGNAAALGLYRKYGFISVGTRKNYYCRPLEDAVLMQRKVRNQDA